MAAISDGFSAFHKEVDDARANMLGSRGSAFSVERANNERADKATSDKAQQAVLDSMKHGNIFASVHDGAGYSDQTKRAVDQKWAERAPLPWEKQYAA